MGDTAQTIDGETPTAVGWAAASIAGSPESFELGRGAWNVSAGREPARSTPPKFATYKTSASANSKFVGLRSE